MKQYQYKLYNIILYSLLVFINLKISSFIVNVKYLIKVLLFLLIKLNKESLHVSLVVFVFLSIVPYTLFYKLVHHIDYSCCQTVTQTNKLTRVQQKHGSPDVGAHFEAESPGVSAIGCHVGKERVVFYLLALVCVPQFVVNV